jgi:hypothetical protein
LPDEPTLRERRRLTSLTAARIALGAIAVGVFSTWTSVDAITLNGVEGPDNGWLVLIMAACALGWSGSMARGSWVGVIGVLGTSVVMASTAVENWQDSRDVFAANAEHGLILVLAGSAVLAGLAIWSGVRRLRASQTRSSGP